MKKILLTTSLSLSIIVLFSGSHVTASNLESLEETRKIVDNTNQNYAKSLFHNSIVTNANFKDLHEDFQVCLGTLMGLKAQLPLCKQNKKLSKAIGAEIIK